MVALQDCCSQFYFAHEQYARSDGNYFAVKNNASSSHLTVEDGGGGGAVWLNSGEENSRITSIFCDYFREVVLSR